VRRAAILASLLALIAPAASAQMPPDYWKQEPWKTCFTRSEAAIGACTTIIDNPATPPPYRARAYTVRGQTYRRQGKVGHALQDYDEALRIDPRQVDGYVSRALLEMDRLDQNDRALRDLNHALALRPNYTWAMLVLSRLYFVQGEFARSLREADAVLKIDPKSAVGYGRRCLARLAIDELEAAIDDCTESLRLQPNMLFAFNGRGSAYLKLGQPDKAEADFDSVIRLRAEAPIALYGRGIARQKSGDRESGDADIAHAKRLLPDVEQRFKHPWQLDQ
jgi:tetratricopeptide (TPR) repeat protein